MPVSMNSSPVSAGFVASPGAASAPVVFFYRTSFARNLAVSSPMT